MLLRDFSFQYKYSGTIARTTLFLTLIVAAFVTKISHARSFQAGLNAMDREHYATAFRAWKDLAEIGEAEAQNNIAFLYERGYGVKQSYTRAISGKKAAAQRDRRPFTTSACWHLTATACVKTIWRPSATSPRRQN